MQVYGPVTCVYVQDWTMNYVTFELKYLEYKYNKLWDWHLTVIEI